jgi:hypothetical protein
MPRKYVFGWFQILLSVWKSDTSTRVFQGFLPALWAIAGVVPLMTSYQLFHICFHSTPFDGSNMFR